MGGRWNELVNVSKRSNHRTALGRKKGLQSIAEEGSGNRKQTGRMGEEGADSSPSGELDKGRRGPRPGSSGGSAGKVEAGSSQNSTANIYNPALS